MITNVRMVQVMGLGTVWDASYKNLIIGQTAPLLYAGAEGNIGHAEIGGIGPNAIVEDLGGYGTARSHFKVWKQTAF